jgi:hypothetical protein
VVLPGGKLKKQESGALLAFPPGEPRRCGRSLVVSLNDCCPDSPIGVLTLFRLGLLALYGLEQVYLGTAPLISYTTGGRRPVASW